MAHTVESFLKTVAAEEQQRKQNPPPKQPDYFDDFSKEIDDHPIGTFRRRL